MKMISWNVNGLRACLQKGFDDFLRKESPDIIALQETKVQPEQLSYTPEGYHPYYFSAVKKATPVRLFSPKKRRSMFDTASVTTDSTPKVERSRCSSPLSRL